MKAITRVCGTLFPLFLLFFFSLPMQGGAAGPEPTQKVSVTIHALRAEKDTQLEPSRPGAEIPVLSGYQGINGISFTLTRVRDGSESVDAPAHTGNGAYRQTRITGRVNGQDGIAVFDDLPFGTYLVLQEPHADYTPATPVFLLEVPLPDPLGGGSLHEIHLYPKYSAPPEGIRDPDFTKEMKKRTGNEVIWEFAWSIPDKIGSGKRLTLTDELDARMRIKTINGKPVLAVRYSNRSGQVSTLPAQYYEVALKDNTVTLTIDSDAGFEQLAKALLPESGRRKPVLTIELTTVIKSGAGGTIYNSGVLLFEDRDGNRESAAPKRDPFVRIEEGAGGLCIYKYDGNTKAPLAGAEFRVFRSKSDAMEGRSSISEGTTGTDGYLLIEALEYENGGTSYWVAETKAPVVNGKQYNLLPAPVEVKVGPYSHQKDNRVEVENNYGFVPPSSGDSGSDNVPVSRVPDSGGMGRRLYYLVGISLLIMACLLLIRDRRKSGTAWREDQ